MSREQGSLRSVLGTSRAFGVVLVCVAALLVGARPSAAQFGACCGGGISCRLSEADSCPPSEFYPGQSCSPSPCPLGACCGNPLLTCVITDSAGCSNGFWVRGELCGGMTCGDPDRVACCRGSVCAIELSVDCVTTGGTPAGALCSPTTCEFGTCCEGNGVCTVGSRVLCVAPGVFVGNTACATGVCDLGACCGGNSCAMTIHATCSGGWFRGETCAQGACMVGACCAGAECYFIFEVLCREPGRRFAGAGVACQPGNRVTPCCNADFDQNGVLTVADIFGYLAAFFSGGINADINGNFVVNVQDIFAFLGAWFAGC